MADSPNQPTDSPESSPAATPTADAGAGPLSSAPKRSTLRRHWGKLTLLTLLGAPSVVFALWAVITLSWSYSSGQRAGYVQKISRKGYVCKTWEGTLYTDIAKGFRADSFSFTVRSDSLAHVIEALGGKKVDVRYEQHIGVPTSCFGDTEYFVTSVTPIPD
jgi:hypothetical protein